MDGVLVHIQTVASEGGEAAMTGPPGLVLWLKLKILAQPQTDTIQACYFSTKPHVFHQKGEELWPQCGGWSVHRDAVGEATAEAESEPGNRWRWVQPVIEQDELISLVYITTCTLNVVFLSSQRWYESSSHPCVMLQLLYSIICCNLFFCSCGTHRSFSPSPSLKASFFGGLLFGPQCTGLRCHYRFHTGANVAHGAFIHSVKVSVLAGLILL